MAASPEVEGSEPLMAFGTRGRWAGSADRGRARLEGGRAFPGLVIDLETIWAEW